MELPLASLEAAFSTDTMRQWLQHWGYGVIFAAMLLENAGLPLPGETVTLLGGYAAGSGQLHLVGVIGAAAGGAILGDNLGYWVGRRAGWPFLLRVGGLLRQSPEQMERLRESFLRHAGTSVLLGRFVAVLRVIAGPMAGAVGMPYRRFLLCNAVGACLWAITMVSLAWLGGRWIPFERMVKGVLEFGIGALLLLTVTLLIPKLVERWQEWRLGEERLGEEQPRP
jgi:membrane protein DedA with SNARE-associated domain